MFQACSLLKKSATKFFSFLIMLVVLTGCASVGRDFNFLGASSVQINRTTQRDIVQNYGTPFRVGLHDGRVEWTYGYYYYTLFGDSQTKDLVIIFNENQTIHSYQYNSSMPEDKKAIAK